MSVDGCAVRAVNADRVAAVGERMPAADAFGPMSDPDLALAHTEHTEVIHPERDGAD
ncbi:hypothetical protein ACIBQ1_46945 [Nonomuraea sp. NPDC050153]|uniref:hypothetical protein n=1 Tax=Nonomuraea sp. NPDC050153 TaxID=3364359 RepID=UPI003798EAED